MKYIYFGSPRFAEIVLGGLIDAGLVPMALVCNPDRPVGRKKVISPPLTKQLVIARKLPTAVLQPEKLDDAFIRTLKTFTPDIFIVAAYGKIIPKAVLEVPGLWNTLGVHPSLLPQYRGASPIQSVILAGETMTGATVYLMDEKMDHGPFCIHPKELSLDPLTTTYVELEERLAKAAVEILPLAIDLHFDSSGVPQPQDESKATYTKKFTAEDAFIKPSELKMAVSGDSDKAELILRTINALNPEPGVWTIKNGRRIKLLKARMDGNAIKLLTIQEEGQRPKSV
jgi:methionyl-tRNA formyltransferase